MVLKLVNTLCESLLTLTGNPNHGGEDMDRIYLNVIGAAGSLGAFLTNGAGDTTREMLLRVPHFLTPWLQVPML